MMKQNISIAKKLMNLEESKLKDVNDAFDYEEDDDKAKGKIMEVLILSKRNMWTCPNLS